MSCRGGSDGGQLRADDLQQFRRDLALPQLVVFESQVLDQVFGIVRAFFMATIRALCSLALALSMTW